MTKENPATDSAEVLHNLVGQDPTTNFEDDPKFLSATPGSEGSSRNQALAREMDDVEEDDEDVEEDDNDVEDEEDDDEDDFDEGEEDDLEEEDDDADEVSA